MSSAILVVEDDLDVATMMRDALCKHGFDAAAVPSGAACLERLRTRPVDVVVTDVGMSGMSGIELCVELRRLYPDVLSLVVTGQGGLDTAIDAIRAGAYDFITKPVKVDVLAIAVSRAIEHLTLRRELKRLRTVTHKDSLIDGVIGSSPPIRATMEMIHRVANSDATVLITGESGTGKELVARALHRLSSRSSEPFLALNCAAMPAPLLESELFGHVRGAFTDAKRSRPGLFVQAGRGTILLDEIGEMPTEMQVKLLRVLQERRVRPVGSDTEVAFEARVVTATNRNLETEVKEKRFREDLFYRINVVAIPVPALRDRTGDILVLAQYFLRRAAARIGKPVEGISSPAARMLLAYDWPGNIRELENCMERAVALCRLDELTIEDLPVKIGEHRSSTMVIAPQSPADLVTLDEMERRYVRHVLGANDGNKTHAARVLGIDRRSIYRRLEGESAEASAHEPAELQGPAGEAQIKSSDAPT
ncbi:MAG: Response regulator of zinc sigma-54-dependent two-component system [Myxococcales bacterium]|nr:Response regulator of zinc sigma-54-dependent two-component system [Myxococcales bacterium]